MNEVTLNWKKIARGLPTDNKAAKDRAPTLEEIHKIIEYPDRRIKPIIYVMASSGIRIGAWDYLRWKHVIPMNNERGEIVAAKLHVYPGDSEEYFTFITPEAYHALKDWMDFRTSYGEKITGESWLMRDIWQTTNVRSAGSSTRGLASVPKQLRSTAVKSTILRALDVQGIRRKSADGGKEETGSHDWKAAHGFRKRFKTICEEVMRPINVELLMGHDIGVSGSYYRPKEREILDDYLKAVPALTISNEGRLKVEVKKLEGGLSDVKILEGRMIGKEKEFQELNQKYASLEERLAIAEEWGRNMQIILKDPKKLEELIKTTK